MKEYLKLMGLKKISIKIWGYNIFMYIYNLQYINIIQNDDRIYLCWNSYKFYSIYNLLILQLVG